MKKTFRSTLIIAGLFLTGVPLQSFAQIVATPFATGIVDPKTIITDGAGNLVIADFGAGTAATGVLDLVNPAGVVTPLTPGSPHPQGEGRRLGIAVRNYLLTHLPRTAAAMREAVARLDRVAFDRGARLTRALAAELLQDLCNDDGHLCNSDGAT